MDDRQIFICNNHDCILIHKRNQRERCDNSRTIRTYN